MRTLEFGQFSGDDFLTHRNISGRSTIVDGNSSNSTTDDIQSPIRIKTSSPGGDSIKVLAKGSLATVRATLGMLPVLLRGELILWAKSLSGGYTYGMRVYRLIETGVDLPDSNYRYKDISGVVTWFGDAYSPVPGRDCGRNPLLSQTKIQPTSTPADYDTFLNLTTEIAYRLRAASDLWILLWNSTVDSFPLEFYDKSNDGKRPFLRLKYFHPVEFFMAAADGSIDLSRIADVEGGDINDNIYLGALQRGETGTAVKCWLRNLGERDFAHVSVWDDAPEWEPIAPATGNTGTGALDLVELFSDAVSQKYTVKFTSASAFQVKAEAFRDNTSSLNPTFGTAGWDGVVSADFTAPAGGLVIPTEAWQPGNLVNDQFYIYVLGNTTNAAWPADSNSQVEIAEDNGSGSPDAATWRPVKGRRARSRASVTVDAVEKKFPTYAVVAANWYVDKPAYVADDTKIQRGTVKQVDVAAIGAVTFTGAGLDDLSNSGNYNGVRTLASGSGYRVEIDATGTPDTFKWSRDGGTGWVATGVAITGAAQLLEDGIYVTFAATTGHTVADRWDFGVTAWGVVLQGLTNNSDVFAAGSRVECTLPIRNLTASVWTRTTAEGGAGSSPNNRLYLESVTGLATSNAVYVQDIENAEVGELITIQTVGSTYIDFTTALVNDYASGSVVLKKGSGEAPFHLRCVVDPGTAEELKQLRLNLRL